MVVHTISESRKRFPCVTDWLLLIWAFGAISKVEDVWTATVEVVFDTEGFAGGIAGEGFGCRYLSAALIFGVC